MKFIKKIIIRIKAVKNLIQKEANRIALEKAPSIWVKNHNAQFKSFDEFLKAVGLYE